MTNVTKNSHYIPNFHLKKWMQINASIFDKANGKTIKLTDKSSTRYFSQEFYYSHNQDDTLEKRLAKFEAFISRLIAKIDLADNTIALTGKELYLLKLYCYLCACRQDNTTEVIKFDESGIYRSNNYLWGIPQIHGRDNIIQFTESIVTEFERVHNDKEFVSLESFSLISDMTIFDNHIRLNLKNLHLCIFRNTENNIALSDVFAIIENTLDSDHLYTYIPVSPKTALFLVKTKYYITAEKIFESRIRLAQNNGAYADPYLSVIFEHEELELVCPYYLVRSAVHIQETYLPKTDFSTVTIKIQDLSNEVVDKFNSIMYEDSHFFIFKDNNQLDRAKNPLFDRVISVN